MNSCLGSWLSLKQLLSGFRTECPNSSSPGPASSACLLRYRCSFPSSRLRRSRGIGSLPGLVRGWSVHRRHGLVQQPEINGELSAVMTGVQHAPPEDPDALARFAKKRNFFHPPLGSLSGEEVQSRTCQINQSLNAWCEFESRRENLRRRGFGRADEFPEEAPLG